MLLPGQIFQLLPIRHWQAGRWPLWTYGPTCYGRYLFHPYLLPGTQELLQCLLSEWRVYIHLFILQLLLSNWSFHFTNSFFCNGQTSSHHLPWNPKHCRLVFHLESTSSNFREGLLLRNANFVGTFWSFLFPAIKTPLFFFFTLFPFLDLLRLSVYTDDFSMLALLFQDGIVH